MPRVYHASKWGLLGLSHALHAEGRQHNIKVTAVVAGGMRTAFLLDRFPDIDVNNLQDPKNVAATVRFVLTAARRNRDPRDDGDPDAGDVAGRERARSRMETPRRRREPDAMRRAVFLDKDGTLIDDVPYNVDPARSG